MVEVNWKTFAMFGFGLSVIFLGGLFIFRHYIHYQPSNSVAGTIFMKSGFHISEACLQCICEAGNVCLPYKCKPGNSCTNFKFSKSYWIDAGSPALEGAVDSVDDSEKAYMRCVSNQFCAARTVRSYVGKYLRDCGGEKVIDCYDYAAIHFKGPGNCSAYIFPSMSFFRLHNCLDTFSMAMKF